MSKHPLQLYSLGMPNDQKVTTIFEGLLTLGITDAGHDAWLVRIGGGDRFSSGFIEVNPNSKIPALRDHTHNPPIRVFESGSILFYLAEKLGYFSPQDPAKRTEVMNWLFWLQDTTPLLSDGFGHFYHHAPAKTEYTINRFTTETKRLLNVLGKQLAQHKSVAGDEYTIADTATWPWFGNVVLGGVYDAAESLNAGSYEHVQRWAKKVGERPTVKRGRIVDRINGPPNERLHERRDTSDFEANTEDKRQG